MEDHTRSDNEKEIEDFIRRSKESIYYRDNTAFANVLRTTNPDQEYLHAVNKFESWRPNQPNSRTWIGITGSWRTITQNVVDDVSELVKITLAKDCGIITGGALGVDYIATEITKKHGDIKNQLRIVLPIKTATYLEHYGNSTIQTGITNRTQGDILSTQIYNLSKNHPETIFDSMPFDEEKFLKDEEYRKSAYNFRNNFVIQGCAGVAAFRVNNSSGVGQALDIAELTRRPIYYGGEIREGVKAKGYNIDPESTRVIRDYKILEESLVA